MKDKPYIRRMTKEQEAFWEERLTPIDKQDSYYLKKTKERIRKAGLAKAYGIPPFDAKALQENKKVDIVCHYCGDSINSYEWTLAIEDGIEVYCCPDCEE